MTPKRWLCSLNFQPVRFTRYADSELDREVARLKLDEAVLRCEAFKAQAQCRAILVRRNSEPNMM